MLGERVANIGHRSVAVLRVALQDDCSAAGSVALVRNLFKGSPFNFTGSSLNGPLDVFGRDRILFGLLDRDAKSRIAGRVSTTRSCGDNDLSTDLRKDLSSDSVLLTFTDANVLPL